MSFMQQEGSYLNLKDTFIYIEDGYSATGAINNGAGESKGDTSITVDGFTTALDVGLPLKIAGDDTWYTIVSTTETSSKTTGIVITPALAAAAADNAVVTVGPHRLEIKIGDGNLTYTEAKPREYKLNRGKIDSVRDGDEVPVEVQTTFAWTYITSASGADTPTIEQFLKRTGPAAAYVSTGDNCDPYAVDLVLVNQPPYCVDETNPVELTRFPQFRYESLQHDAKAGTVQISGKCNATEVEHERLTSWL